MSDERDARERLAAGKARWERETLGPHLARAPERPDPFTTVSGQPVARLYTPLDVADADYERTLGFPGEYPFTRGVQPTMYRGRLWTMRQFSGFGSAEETNRRYRYLVEQGQMGLSVAFHLPTLMGFDSDDPRAAGEVGRCGVAADALQDMQVIFRDLPLDRITTSMTINSTAAIAWAMYLAVCESRGIPRDRVGGTLQNDILKEYIAQKEYVFPPAPSLRLVTDTIVYATRHYPRWNSISISGYHIREAGATAVQELAFTLADGLTYVQEAIRAGLEVDSFAPRLSFFWDIHNDLFEEVAKFRAARRLWARLMRERFGAKNPRAWMLRTHAQTAGVSLTAQQPYLNIARVALQALAGVLGGTQSLHTNSMDEAYALPTQEAVTIALRTQQVIAYETGVANTVDPLAGSYYVEALTDRMEAAAQAYLAKIDDLGGMVRAIEQGFPQQEIANAAYAYQQAVERGEKVIVGVNRFVDESERRPIPILAIDEALQAAQAARLAELRRRRDGGAWRRALDDLRRAAEGDDPWGEDLLMPRILHAVKAEATVGEIVGVLREAWGEYTEPNVV
ncbi:MAG: methylmalonyl-CoA mutase [Candidatus Methylomirabilales bacterium]